MQVVSSVEIHLARLAILAENTDVNGNTINNLSTVETTCVVATLHHVSVGIRFCRWQIAWGIAIGYANTLVEVMTCFQCRSRVVRTSFTHAFQCNVLSQSIRALVDVMARIECFRLCLRQSS